jgi:hypothetical protein
VLHRKNEGATPPADVAETTRCPPRRPSIPLDAEEEFRRHEHAWIAPDAAEIALGAPLLVERVERLDIAPVGRRARCASVENGPRAGLLCAGRAGRQTKMARRRVAATGRP